MKTYIIIALFLSMLCPVSAMTTADFYLTLSDKVVKKKPAPAKKVQKKKAAKIVSAKKPSKKPGKKAVAKKPAPAATSSSDYRVNLKLWNSKTKKIKVKGARTLVIDTKTQRARLYAGKHLVMIFPVTTGKRGKSTPKGSFSITEKIVDKRSNRYGYRDKKGRFIGARMPYWMRFNGAIGIHQGKLHSYPASNGCVRVSPVVASLLYNNMGKGSRVSVR